MLDIELEIIFKNKFLCFLFLQFFRTCFGLLIPIHFALEESRVGGSSVCTFTITLVLRISYLHLRDRFLLTVTCCPVYHWLVASREVDISRARSASDIFIDD